MKPIGSAWKLPPERMSLPKMSGLSDTPLMRRREDLARVVDGVLDRAENLRHAAHRIRILHALAILVTATDFAVCQQPAQLARDFDLAGQAARLLDAIVERCVAAREAFDRQRAGHDGRIEQPLRLQQAFEREREAQLRAIQQREPFLRLQLERLDARRVQHHGRRRSESARPRVASPSPISASVRWASGARSPEAPTEPCAGIDGQHVGVEQREQHVDDLRAARRRSPPRGCSP